MTEQSAFMTRPERTVFAFFMPSPVDVRFISLGDSFIYRRVRLPVGSRVAWGKPGWKGTFK